MKWQESIELITAWKYIIFSFKWNKRGNPNDKQIFLKSHYNFKTKPFIFKQVSNKSEFK